MSSHQYTPEQVKFLAANITGRSYREMTDKFNMQFGTQLSISQINGALKNRKLCNGRNTRFKPGSAPFNKGKKGVGGWEPTQFEKGHRPHNYMPVGTERLNGDGYIDIKIADPHKWRTKHSLLWEAKNGPVPKGYVVIFGDGNRFNLELDNLVLVSRRQLAMINKMGLIGSSADLTRVGVTVADILMKITERSNARKSR